MDYTSEEGSIIDRQKRAINKINSTKKNFDCVHNLNNLIDIYVELL